MPGNGAKTSDHSGGVLLPLGNDAVEPSLKRPYAWNGWRPPGLTEAIEDRTVIDCAVTGVGDSDRRAERSTGKQTTEVEGRRRHGASVAGRNARRNRDKGTEDDGTYRD